MLHSTFRYYTLLVLLLIANVYILWHRNDGFKYQAFKTIPALYVVDSSLYLQDLHFTNDSVQLILSQTPNTTYTLEVQGVPNNPPQQIKPHNNRLSFKILDSIHTYRLHALQPAVPSIHLIIDHSNYKGQYTNEFIYCNLSGPNIATTSLAPWHSAAHFSQQEQATAISYLKQANFSADSSDYYNALAIARYVSNFCINQQGIHSYELAKLRPDKQIEIALQCNANLACGNYAAILGYLYSCARIPNRLVTFTGPGGNWQYGAHYFNEVYLRAQQQWCLVDANSHLALPFDSTTGKYITAQSLQALVQNNGLAGKKTYAFTKDSNYITNYDRLNAWHVYYNQSNANLTYLHANANLEPSLLNNFISFYTFERDTETFSSINSNNWGKIFLKELMAIALLLTLLWGLIKKARNKKGE